MTARESLETGLFSSFDNSIKKCFSFDMFPRQSGRNDDYSIIYINNSINNYTLLNYDNFTNSFRCEYNNISLLNSFNSISKKNAIINEVLEIKQEELMNNLKDIMDEKEIGVNYEIKGDNFSILIKPTNSTFFPNSTYVEFDECEQKLRSVYNISNSSIITFFQIEINNNQENSLYNQIKYFTYDENKTLLDLSICEELSIPIHYSIKNDSKIDISSISNFKYLGVDIMDIKDKFFNDLCYSYSHSNNDMILEDRIKYIYQNYSLCKEGCSYDTIDIDNMNIICNCSIQGNDNANLINITPLLYEQPKDISFFDSNIGVIKCYNLVFSFNNKANNIGFIIFTILFLLYLIFMICYCIKGIKPIINYIYHEMVKNGYLNQDEPKFFERRGNKNNKKKKKKNTISNPNKNKSKSIKIIKKKKTKSNLPTTNKNSSISQLNKIKTTKTIKKLNLTHEVNEDNNFGIIKINLNEIKNYIPQNSNQSLHNYTFKDAIEHCKRNVFRIAYIYLLAKQIIFRTFFNKSPLELFPLRFNHFIFMLSSDLALNALFYFNDNISKKYHYAKNLFLFTFSNNITIIIYSTLISYFLITLLNKLSNSTNAIRSVFEKEEEKVRKNKEYKLDKKIKDKIYSEIEIILRNLKIKIAILFFIETILILFFGYFATAFCHIYSNTQISWIFDSFLAILSRLIIELFFSFFYGKLYTISIGSNIRTFYNVIMCIYDFS